MVHTLNKLVSAGAQLQYMYTFPYIQELNSKNKNQIILMNFKNKKETFIHNSKIKNETEFQKLKTTDYRIEFQKPRYIFS